MSALERFVRNMPDNRHEELGELLAMIEEYDRKKEYDNRYIAVIGAMTAAITCGYATGIRLDTTEPEWPVVFIELPEGQVSWHMPQHTIAWDGHDNDEKYRRCAMYRNAQHGAYRRKG